MKLIGVLTLSVASLAATFAAARQYSPKLINGKEAKAGEFPEVVYISMNGSRCSATAIGPRVIVTAAHCGETGEEASFQIGQTVYKAKLKRSPIYEEGNPDKDHDISIGLVDKDMAGVKYASVGGKATTGSDITLAGYGCTQVGGTGGNDGILRYADSTIRANAGYDMESTRQGGGALCFGDSGGPAFTKIANPVADHHFLLGINSKGNIRDTNWNCRTDTQASQDFFKNFANQNSVSICGVNRDCSGGTNPTPTPTPTSTSSPQPNSCRDQMTGADGARKVINQRISELKSCMQTNVSADGILLND